MSATVNRKGGATEPNWLGNVCLQREEGDSEGSLEAQEGAACCQDQCKTHRARTLFSAHRLTLPHPLAEALVEYYIECRYNGTLYPSHDR